VCPRDHHAEDDDPAWYARCSGRSNEEGADMTRTIRIVGGAVLALTLGLTPALGAEKRTDHGPTASDQSNDPTDLRLTQEIRKALVDDDSLSMNAHNVKVITNRGIVTLRGPVDDAAEAARVVAVAERVAGAKRVRNELEVSKQ
jgi:hypothetical protein